LCSVELQSQHAFLDELPTYTTGNSREILEDSLTLNIHLKDTCFTQFHCLPTDIFNFRGEVRKI
jgi:hypothetical protein